MSITSHAQTAYLSSSNTPEENLALIAQGQYYSQGVLKAKSALSHYYNVRGGACITLCVTILAISILCGKYINPYGYFGLALLVVPPLYNQSFKEKMKELERNYSDERQELDRIYTNINNMLWDHISNWHEIMVDALNQTKPLLHEKNTRDDLGRLIAEIVTAVRKVKDDAGAKKIIDIAQIASTKLTQNKIDEVRQNLANLGFFSFIGNINPNHEWSTLRSGTQIATRNLHSRIQDLLRFENCENHGFIYLQRVEDKNGRQWRATLKQPKVVLTRLTKKGSDIAQSPTAEDIGLSSFIKTINELYRTFQVELAVKMA